MSTPLNIEDFWIKPLGVEYPTVDDLDYDELSSPGLRWTQLVILIICGAIACLASAILLQIALLFLGVIMVLLAQWHHLRKMLQRKFAQRIRCTNREAYLLRVYLINNFQVLEKNNGFAQSRLFRLKRTMTKLEGHYEKRLHLSFEREYRALMAGFHHDINWLLRCIEQEEKYQELLEGRIHNLPDSMVPLWEIKGIKHEFAGLIEKIDGDPTFATIIIILKAADKQLDPERILRKLKWKNRV